METHSTGPGERRGNEPRGELGPEVIAEMPSGLQRAGIYVVTLVVAAALILLYFGRVHVVVTGRGKVVPEGDVVLVQALQGGVVNAVLARPGDRLAAGAPIVRIDVSESGVNLAQLRRRSELQASQLGPLKESASQLDRVLANPQLAAPDKRAGWAPPLGSALQLITAFDANRIRLEGARSDLDHLPERQPLQSKELQLLRQKIQLMERSQKDDERFVAAQEAALQQKKEQLLNFRKLAEKRVISPLEMGAEEEKFRAADSAAVAARQRHEQQEIEIANTKLRESELVGRLLGEGGRTQAAFRAATISYNQSAADLRQELENLRLQIKELEAAVEGTRAKIGLAETQLSLASVTMPVAGTLAELKVNNPGELLAVGAVVASVVPEHVPLVIEAQVPNRDIGFVRPGAEARVKVDAYPFQQFGTVAARVSRILPTLSDSSFFTVRLSVPDPRLHAATGDMPLFPGLTVEAELLTARQRLLDLLMRPAPVPAEPSGKGPGNR